MRTDTLKHGSNQIGQTYYGERCWKRRDTYTPKDGRQAITESRFAAGREDVSHLFIDGDTGHYDSRCSCCFLGFSHTVDAHNERTERAVTTQQTILRACNHLLRPCEVNLGTNRKPEVIFVCSHCWNTSVYAARDERKAQLADHWAKVREAQAEAMQAAGQTIGQRVSYFCASMLGIGGYVVKGTIKLNRNKIAVIKFDCPQNGKTSTEWVKGWKVIA